MRSCRNGIRFFSDCVRYCFFLKNFAKIFLGLALSTGCISSRAIKVRWNTDFWRLQYSFFTLVNKADIKSILPYAAVCIHFVFYIVFTSCFLLPTSPERPDGTEYPDAAGRHWHSRNNSHNHRVSVWPYGPCKHFLSAVSLRKLWCC